MAICSSLCLNFAVTDTVTAILLGQALCQQAEERLPSRVKGRRHPAAGRNHAPSGHELAPRLQFLEGFGCVAWVANSAAL